jgi:protein TonB
VFAPANFAEKMSDRHDPALQFQRRYATPALTPALLFSLAVHAAVGGILLQTWRIATVEPPRPLTVVLEAAPVTVERPPVPIVEHKHANPAPNSRALPVQQLHHAPAPSVIAVERVEAAPAMTAPVTEAPAAPVVVARAPASVSAPGRGDAIEPPHFNVAYLNNPKPPYPPIARKLGLEGVVLLRVEVSAKGTADKVVIAHSSGAELLDEAAMRAVQGWTFVPARRGETPVAHPVEVPIRFQLKN